MEEFLGELMATTWLPAAAAAAASAGTAGLVRGLLPVLSACWLATRAAHLASESLRQAGLSM